MSGAYDNDSYGFHRSNAEQMDDETLLRNIPSAAAMAVKTNWAAAMLDEAVYRGILEKT